MGLGGRFGALRPPSAALLPEALLRSLGDQFRQPHEVVSGATEDEQPSDLVKSAQLHLADRSGLLEPSKSLFDQPSAAQESYFAPIIASRTERSDATKTFMTSKTITVA
jgi:hypothetical protein